MHNTISHANSSYGPANLLKRLVQIPSVSGTEKNIALFIFRLLQPYFKTTLIPVKKNQFNIIATTGKPRIYLSTHLDTVPIGSSFFKETADNIFGRGSCDAKGSLAAMISTGITLRKIRTTNFGLFFTCGEETDFCGIKNGLPEKKPPFVIIGEPTQLIPMKAQKGLLAFRLISKGKKAHGATPEKGKNSILMISNAIQKLKSIKWPKNKVYGKTAINIGVITGGTCTNVVPDLAEIACEIRTVIPNQAYKKILSRCFRGYEIVYNESFDPTSFDNKKARLIENITKKRPKIMGQFSELCFWPTGLVIGPGNSDLAHTDHEHIEKKELSKAVSIYTKIIEKIQRG